MTKNFSFFMGLLMILAIFVCPVIAQPPSSDSEIRDKVQDSQEDAPGKVGSKKETQNSVVLETPSEEAVKTSVINPEAVVDALAEPEKSGSAAETRESEPQIVIDSDNSLMTLNLFDVDIREALSALAMEREINIAAAKDVSGKVSVHLYEVHLNEALEAITLAGGFSYNKQGDLYYVYKPKAAVDPQARSLRIRMFKLKHAEGDKMKEVLDGIPGLRSVKVHEPSSTIIVEDTPNNVQKIENVISYLDLKPRQVMIEAKILEVILTDDMSFGVNWQDIVAGEVKIGTGGFSTAVLPSNETTPPVPGTGTGMFANLITAAGTKKQFALALDALQSKTRINTLSTPKILAIHGKPARVQVGGQQGYKVTTTNVGVATESVQFIDTGTILDITPYIDDEGNVLLNVQPSITSAQIEEGVPVTRTTLVSTWLMAKNGETVFIGGLIQDSKTKTRDMIPCFGGIPGLGVLFGRTFRGIGKTELIVLITPSILDDRVKGHHRINIEKTKKIEEELKKEPAPTIKQLFDFSSPVK
jgi:type II secretory pathway component GspD/PulD (secretin)